MQQMNLPIIPIQLDSSMVMKINIDGSTFQGRSLMSCSNVWHKIQIIRGTQYPKEVVLRSILNAIEPAELIPVTYQAIGEDTFFIARNCTHAIDKLCKTNLIINNIDGDVLILVVTLGYASVHDHKINLQPLLLNALKKRYNFNKKSLNLAEFHMDSDISTMVYWPLFQQRTFSHILKLTKSTIAEVKELNLQKNGLHNLSPIETSGLTTIKHLDLRYNNLINMEALAALKHVCIVRLWLDGNPLCENYSNTKRYIESALKYCPNLIQLDGVYIKTDGLPLLYREYYKNNNKAKLVSQFVNHFFNLYDQGDRTVLRGLYHKNAFYSMSFGIASHIAHARNLVQFTENRNLMRNSHSNKKKQHIYYGQENILNSFRKLPRSYHDRNSFLCDLMYNDSKCLAISINGVFKTANNFSQVLWFNRTFIIQAGPDHEYNILNDQYHVDATLEEISPNSIELKILYDEPTLDYFSTSEKKEILHKFSETTQLNIAWCRSYLDEAKWNIRKAICNFMKDYKSSAVPVDAFSK